MGLVGALFGIASALVVLISAFSPARGARFLSIVLFIMWVTTKIWNYRAGTDEQIYLDACLTVVGFMSALAVALQNHKLVSPRFVMACMALTAIVHGFYAALYSLPNVAASDTAKFVYQLACNVLYGAALAVAATPGVHHGACAFHSWLSRHRERGAWSPARGRSSGEAKGSIPRHGPGRK